MTYSSIRVLGLAGVLAGIAFVGGAQSQASPGVADLSRSIRGAVDTARAGAAADPAETTVITVVADVIVEANRPPEEALSAVRLAIADEGCLLNDGIWNRWGCGGLSNVASTIENSITGAPAAVNGQGGIAIGAQPGLPGAGSGADYRSPVGV